MAKEFFGEYYVNNDPKNKIIVRGINEGLFSIESPGVWSGIGYYSDFSYIGVYKYKVCFENAHLSGVRGHHHIIKITDDSFLVNGKNMVGASTEFWYKWTRIKNGE